MKYCGSCGSPLEDEAVFCSNCGAHVDEVDAPTELLDMGGFGGSQGFPEPAPTPTPTPTPAPTPNPTPAPVFFGGTAAKPKKEKTPSGDNQIGIDLIFTVLSVLAAVIGIVFLVLDITSVAVGLIILAVSLISAIVAVILTAKAESKFKLLNIILCTVSTLILLSFIILTIVFFSSLKSKGCPQQEISSSMQSGFMSLAGLNSSYEAGDSSEPADSGNTQEPATAAPSEQPAPTEAPTQPPQTEAPTQPPAATTMPVYVPTPQQSVVAYAGTELVVNTNRSNLMLRSGKSTSSPVIARMPKGAHVTVYTDYYDDGWVQVVYNGQVGWASAQYLAIYRY